MIRNLRWILTGEDKSASAALDRVGKKADTTGSKLRSMSKFAAVGGAAFGAGVVALGPKVFSLASQMEILDAKAKTVFGPKALTTVQKWATANAGAMGLTNKEAVGLSAGFADLLIPMGFTRDAAAKMSTDVVGLSGALSRWTGGQKSAAEVADVLSAAMLGETDGLKGLGISISAADIDAKMLKNGTDKLTGAQEQQARATATQQLIFEKSTDAQTAYAKGGETLAAKQAKVSAAIKELRDKAIAALLPKLQEFSTWITNVGLPAFEGLVQGFKDGTGAGGEIRNVLQVIGETAQTAATILNATVVPIIRWFADHPDAMKGVALGMAAYATAVKSAAIWSALVKPMPMAPGVPGKGGKGVPLLGINPATAAGAAGLAGIYAGGKYQRENAKGFGKTWQNNPVSNFLFGKPAPAPRTAQQRGAILGPQVTVHTTLNLDGKPIARTVTKHQRTSVRTGAKPAFGL